MSTKSEEEYQSLIQKFNNLESSGHLQKPTEGMVGSHEESSFDKFLNDPKNRGFLPEETRKQLNTKEKEASQLKKEDVINEKKINEKRELKDDTGAIDWELISELYELGKSKGYI